MSLGQLFIFLIECRSLFSPVPFSSLFHFTSTVPLRLLKGGVHLENASESISETQVFFLNGVHINSVKKYLSNARIMERGKCSFQRSRRKRGAVDALTLYFFCRFNRGGFCQLLFWNFIQRSVRSSLNYFPCRR